MKIKSLSLIVSVLFFCFCLPVQAQPGARKILVAYFSHSGNTRVIANQIYKSVGGDIFEIQSVRSYSADYNTVVEQAKQELQSGYIPPLKNRINHMKIYEVIFIGYPIWWGTFPAPVKAFLLQNNLSGKIVIPFCTHEGSELGQSVNDIRKLCPKSTILSGLAIRGHNVNKSQREVQNWLKKLNVVKVKN